MENAVRRFFGWAHRAGVGGRRFVGISPEHKRMNINFVRLFFPGFTCRLTLVCMIILKQKVLLLDVSQPVLNLGVRRSRSRSGSRSGSDSRSRSCFPFARSRSRSRSRSRYRSHSRSGSRSRSDSRSGSRPPSRSRVGAETQKSCQHWAPPQRTT